MLFLVFHANLSQLTKVQMASQAGGTVGVKINGEINFQKALDVFLKVSSGFYIIKSEARAKDLFTNASRI